MLIIVRKTKLLSFTRWQHFSWHNWWKWSWQMYSEQNIVMWQKS